ncbi:MAG: hypothetical protein ACETVX_04265 [bacterium]|nr:hypothetical protein [candidate division WOR-3 bacterium]MDH5683727.1 hypothetical protein [candidate division WOR-3 bacterium]
MKTFWDDVKIWLGDATKTAIKEAEDLTRKGRLKMEMLALSRRIEKKMAELGGFVYHRLSRGEVAELANNDTVKDYLKVIRKLELEMKRKKKQWKENK